MEHDYKSWRPKSTTTSLNLPNQARGDCFKPFKDFLNLHTILDSPRATNPGVAPYILLP